MSEMVERCARAVCQLGGRDPDEVLVELGGVKTHAWEAFTDVVRTVLAAAREPTEAMIVAGYNADDDLFDRQLRKAWPAMIDAALDNPPKA